MTYDPKTFFAAAALSISLLIPGLAQADDNLSAAFSHTIDHITNHGVSVVRSSDGGSLVVLETAFNTANKAELRILLGRNGNFTPEADLGSLARITGLQVFKVPASIDIDRFNEVHIWNPENRVIVGTAPLK